MDTVFIFIKLCCFLFGATGIVISLIELMKFVLARRMAKRPREATSLSPIIYKRMATAHLAEFFVVLSIAVSLIIVSFINVT